MIFIKNKGLFRLESLSRLMDDLDQHAIDGMNLLPRHAFSLMKPEAPSGGHSLAT